MITEWIELSDPEIAALEAHLWNYAKGLQSTPPIQKNDWAGKCDWSGSTRASSRLHHKIPDQSIQPDDHVAFQILCYPNNCQTDCSNPVAAIWLGNNRLSVSLCRMLPPFSCWLQNHSAESHMLVEVIPKTQPEATSNHCVSAKACVTALCFLKRRRC